MMNMLLRFGHMTKNKANLANVRKQALGNVELGHVEIMIFANGTTLEKCDNEFVKM